MPVLSSISAPGGSVLGGWMEARTLLIKCKHLTAQEGSSDGRQGPRPETPGRAWGWG